MKISEKIKLQEEKRKAMTFDRLKMYFGKDYTTKNGIVIREPRIGEILDYGEQNFYSSLNVFIANPTTFRLPLWNIGVDWNKITEFSLFILIYRSIEPEVSELICPGTDLCSFEPLSYEDEEGNQFPILYNEKTDVAITEDDYLEISEYLRTMFNMFPKTERAKGRSTKEAIIWEDEENAKVNKDKTPDSILLPLVSSCINHPGFKYKLSELTEVGICQFMDSVQRLQVYESTRALLAESMSGFCDTSKISKEEFNFMRDLSAKNKT